MGYERDVVLQEGEILQIGFERGIITSTDKEESDVYFSYRVLQPIIVESGRGLTEYSNMGEITDEDLLEMYANYGIDGLDELIPLDYSGEEVSVSGRHELVVPGRFIHIHDLAIGAVMSLFGGAPVLGREYTEYICYEPDPIPPNEVDAFIEQEAATRVAAIEKRLGWKVQ